ncbi:hypothetical protein BS78_07G096000 [Paspalum vaginatum]|nr:hypothetical protein BS78_07G096000 [Paspalum vaginatum]
MALRASETGLVVLCFVSLLLLSSVANANGTSGAHGAGRKMMSYDDYEPPITTYPTGPPVTTYPAVPYDPPPAKP